MATPELKRPTLWRNSMRRGSLPNSIDDHHPPVYHAFLLRLWCHGDTPVWHALRQPTDTNARLGFADLEHLVTYLRGLLSTPSAR
jgi:hypothetical protein